MHGFVEPARLFFVLQQARPGRSHPVDIQALFPYFIDQLAVIDSDTKSSCAFPGYRCRNKRNRPEYG